MTLLIAKRPEDIGVDERSILSRSDPRNNKLDALTTIFATLKRSIYLNLDLGLTAFKSTT